jgi:hypothetical protein
MSGLSLRNTNFTNLWANFERRTLEIFIIALEMLSTESMLPEEEDDEVYDSLNRRLHQCLDDAITKWESLNGREPICSHAPTYNAPQPPNKADKGVARKREFERKKPDFQWGIRDSRQIASVEEARNSLFIPYHIECKRLRSKRDTRYFTSDYVKAGICRFIQESHCYGQYATSGAMIAYVQDTEPQTLLNEVNRHAGQVPLPQLQIASGGWQTVVSQLEHRLDRTEVQPTPFDLRHLWVDLRHHYAMLNIEGSEGKESIEELPKPVRQSRQRKSNTSPKKTASPAQKPDQKHKRKTQ